MIVRRHNGIAAPRLRDPLERLEHSCESSFLAS
jgi:hypothetical protein